MGASDVPGEQSMIVMACERSRRGIGPTLYTSLSWHCPAFKGLLPRSSIYETVWDKLPCSYDHSVEPTKFHNP